MWTKKEFSRVLSRHPDGGTFWTGTKRCVRYIRVFRDGDTMVAVMTEHFGWCGRHDTSVSLFVQDNRGSRVSFFKDPAKTVAFKGRLLNATALLWVRAHLRQAASVFVAQPPRETMPEMFPLW